MDVSGSFREIPTEVTNIVKRIPRTIPHQDMTAERLEGIDIARGLAITLMMLGHTVMALNTYQMLPDFAIIPIHLITKLASSLFIFIFGISIALFYLEGYDTENWPRKRNRLFWRAFSLLVWYKILTIAQMFQTRPKGVIIDTLLFKNFTDFVEVLNFYWFAVLWLLLLIPLWVRMHWSLKLVTIAAFAVAGALLNKYFDFWGAWQIKAMLVEFKGTYCYGAFQRGALVLLGMFLAGTFIKKSTYERDRTRLGLIILGIGVVLSAYFVYYTGESHELQNKVLYDISHNVGKHPPNFDFMIFSLAGALSIFGICLHIPEKISFLFKPLALIGREPFFCFNYHIILIFVGFRYLLNLRLKVSYTETLLLFLVVFVSSFLLSPVNSYIKRKGILWKWMLP